MASARSPSPSGWPPTASATRPSARRRAGTCGVTSSTRASSARAAEPLSRAPGSVVARAIARRRVPLGSAAVVAVPAGVATLEVDEILLLLGAQDPEDLRAHPAAPEHELRGEAARRFAHVADDGLVGGVVRAGLAEQLE